MSLNAKLQPKTSESDCYVGLMSGTSMDGIDAVAVQFTAQGLSVLSHSFTAYSDAFVEKTQALLTPGNNELHRAYSYANEHALMAARTLTKLKLNTPIRAAGYHGQTVRHLPLGQSPYSIQLGSAALLAEKSGLTIVHDFRARDIAAGGQGAPLMPAVHHALFTHPSRNRAIVNLGGIANVSVLPAGGNAATSGFDTGPANTLMDHWVQKHRAVKFDKEGDWAASGDCNIALLNSLLSDPYFKLLPPKSTSIETFNLEWLTTHLQQHPTSAVDVQTTLLELTCQSLYHELIKLQGLDEVILCGGGAKNSALLKRLQSLCDCPVTTSDEHGIASQQLEAVGFAWLAKQTLASKATELSNCTGSKGARILGAIHQS